eukprot:GHVL01032319.1.p1 GENE.GHVL01032319.1~~GHVL01032319.1.p1  ORF type:complete len:920 (-),score=34.35 GHVL01032319.1:223-2982(-)
MRRECKCVCMRLQSPNVCIIGFVCLNMCMCTQPYFIETCAATSVLCVAHVICQSSTALIWPFVVGSLITQKNEVANVLASTMEKNSSTENYCTDFQKIKATQERKPINFSSQNEENYNKLFSITELKQALQKCNNSATGLDGIHYQVLTHLPESCLLVLLKVFNHIWESGSFPPSWQEAMIVPIPKPGKDHTNPSNYRPIALTSCLCKTMERLVNARMVWYLEKQNLLSDVQCGFRKGHSTTDHLVRFETFVREAFARSEHVLAIFFDLEKAYDTTWKHGILADLHEMGFRGRLPVFVEGFLSNRLFTVRVGPNLSEFCQQEMGVPQGSILSPMLFNIKINNIVKAVLKGSESSLFVDDFALCVRGKSLHRVERQLQLCIDKVQKWVTENGFKFSTSKTVCMHLCKQRGAMPEPSLVLNGNPVKVVEEFKFLGLTFDRRLTFLKHIQYLRTSCLKALDVLKVVSHTDWGADRTVLLRLYRALIRSKLDYGCVVYGGAAKSNLRLLDTIHHQGIRLCLGAFRTSPVQSLYFEAKEPSLRLRRLKLTLNYVLKLKAMPTNPAYQCVFQPQCSEFFESHPNDRAPLSSRIQSHLAESKIKLDHVSENRWTETPPWTLPDPVVRLDLTRLKKSETNDLIFKQCFSQFCTEFPSHQRIYTDGSKAESKVASASVTGPKLDRAFSARLPDDSSVFSAELKALQLALKQVYQSKKKDFLILSDSLSALTAVKRIQLDHPLLVEIQELHASLIEEGKRIVFAWVPSHVGIRGNSAADQAAKEARERLITDKHTKHSDFRTRTNMYIKYLWQSEWDECEENKLHKIVPQLSDSLPQCRLNRKEETVLCRLHIGHSHITHSYLLKGEDPPYCFGCDEPWTLEHVLTKCVDVQEFRDKHYNAQTLKVLFRDVPPDKIFNFLKEIKIFYKI